MAESSSNSAARAHPSAPRQGWWKPAAVLLFSGSILLMPTQPGLSIEGQRVLAIVVAAVVLWATEALPVAVSSLLALVLLSTLGGAKTPSDALIGFSSPILYFLLGSQVMGLPS